jgi:hypothetical protein
MLIVFAIDNHKIAKADDRGIPHKKFDVDSVPGDAVHR